MIRLHHANIRTRQIKARRSDQAYDAMRGLIAHAREDVDSAPKTKRARYRSGAEG